MRSKLPLFAILSVILVVVGAFAINTNPSTPKGCDCTGPGDWAGG